MRAKYRSIAYLSQSSYSVETNLPSVELEHVKGKIRLVGEREWHFGFRSDVIAGLTIGLSLAYIFNL
jgi:hypothetical protein